MHSFGASAPLKVRSLVHFFVNLFSIFLFSIRFHEWVLPLLFCCHLCYFYSSFVFHSQPLLEKFGFTPDKVLCCFRCCLTLRLFAFLLFLKSLFLLPWLSCIAGGGADFVVLGERASSG